MKLNVSNCKELLVQFSKEKRSFLPLTSGGICFMLYKDNHDTMHFFKNTFSRLKQFFHKVVYNNNL